MTGGAVRPGILAFLSSYLPAFRSGGPIRTLEAMTAQMSDEWEFLIVAADRDLGDDGPFPGVPVNTWITCGPARVFYRSPGVRGWIALLRSLESIDYDVIYLNSFFGTHASLIPLLLRRAGWLRRRPVVVAPRGELDPGALALKHRKKAAFLKAARLVRLHRGVVWHASNPVERESILRHTRAPAPQVFQALDLSGRSSGAATRKTERASGEPLRITFLSRISPIKNLRFALEVLTRVTVPVQFDIHGIIEDLAYWEGCQKAMADLPSHVTARYVGEVLPQDVESTLAGYDLFLFPTLGENYGHVIRESLSAGLPALISDTTPWRGLEAKGAGADLPLDDPGRFAAWIDAYHRLPPDRQTAMRAAAARAGDDPEAAARNLQDNRDLFRAALTLSTMRRIALQSHFWLRPFTGPACSAAQESGVKPVRRRSRRRR